MTTEYTDHFRLNLPDFRMGPWHDLVNEDFIMIDGLLFSLYQGVDTQTWANNTHYKPGTTAIDPADNTFWVAIVEHTSAPTGTFATDRAAHPGYWNRVVVGIAPRGEWLNNAHYLPNDMVTDSSEGIIGVCKTEHTSNASGTIRDDAVYWTFLADIGSVAALAENISYDNTTSGATGTDLQTTTDDLYAKNNTQQTQINANTSFANAAAPRITALESSDTAQNTTIAGHTTAINTNTNNITLLNNRATALENADVALDSRLDTLEAGGFIGDAPSDGVTYARKNHAWIDVLSVAGASVLISDTPPAGARDSSLWWESDSGQLFIRYNDGDTTQWVTAVPQVDVAGLVAKSGDTMTGDLTIQKDLPAITLNNTGSTPNDIKLQRSGLMRWLMRMGPGPDVGGDTSQFRLYGYNDAGDTATLVLEGSRVTNLLTVKGDPTAALGIATKQYVDNYAVHGSVVLELDSGNLRLRAEGGGRLIVNGVMCTVSLAGVLLPPTGFTPGGLYYIYAVATNGVVTSLEASATVPAYQNSGIKTKTGDATRTLVGMAACVAGPAWVDSGSQRFVLSFFNRKDKESKASLTTTRSTVSAVFVELHTEFRAEFLAWGDENVQANLCGTGYTSGATNFLGSVALAFDGALVPGSGGLSDGTAGAQRPLSSHASVRLTEGKHYATVFGAGNGAAGAINVTSSGGSSNGNNSTLYVTIRG